MPSTESLYLTDLYADWLRRMDGMDVPTIRDLFEEWHLPTIEPTNVTYEEVDAGGVPAIWANPIGAAADRVIVYTHGGGFAASSAYSHRKLAAHLAKATGVRALVVNYRLGPEHQYPAQLEDSESVHRWLHGLGFAAEHLATAGDSAGGNLAVSTPRWLASHGVPAPAAVVAISPWLDMELTGATLETNDANDAIVKRGVLEGMRTLFLDGAGERTDPFANPLLQDFTGAPPTYITVGGYETLQSDSERLTEVLARYGVDHVLDIVPEQQHVFPCLAGRAPEADAVIQRIATWLRPRLGL